MDTSAHRQQVEENTDKSMPEFLQQMQTELRLRHYSLDTEKAYLAWVRRFAIFTGSPDLERFAENDIKEFLSKLVVDGNVATSTQNQAMSALLFLYQKVCGSRGAMLHAQRGQAFNPSLVTMPHLPIHGGKVKNDKT